MLLWWSHLTTGVEMTATKLSPKMIEAVRFLAKSEMTGTRAGLLMPQRNALMARGLVDYASGDDVDKQDRHRVVALTNEGRDFILGAAGELVRAELKAEKHTAQCPNPWHKSNPARGAQLCPECPA
jgi:hypothetical protein